jgi:hypothetical protein
MYCRTPPRPRRCSRGPRRSTTTASTRRDTASASPSPRSRTPVLDAESPSNGGRGKILRAGIDIPAGHTAVDRGDIEVLFEGLPEPIDLDLDTRMLYWTDPPLGNTVNRAPMDPVAGQRKSEILLTHLQEGIGVALDLNGGRMFVTDLTGSVYQEGLDGSRMTEIMLLQGNLTGIAYAEVPGTQPV